MMLTRSNARSIGWAVILGLCFALTIALTFRVNAVRSQVRLAERKIAVLQAEKGLLETEFETRANQQQLTALNEVEFGYQAPTASQYLESERQLAALGKPRGPDAPPMIRVAAADPARDHQAGDSMLPAMVNPLTGKALAAEVSREPMPSQMPSTTRARMRADDVAARGTAAGLADRLARVEQLSHRAKVPQVVARAAPRETPAAPSKAAPAKSATLRTATARAATAKAATAKAAPAKPATVRPAIARPAIARPGTGQSGTGQSGTGQSGTGQSGTGKPAVAKSGASRGAASASHAAARSPTAQTIKVAIR